MPGHGGQLRHVSGPADQVRLRLVPELRQMRGEGSVRPRFWYVAEQQSDLPKSRNKIVRTGNGPLGRKYQCDDTWHQSRQDF